MSRFDLHTHSNVSDGSFTPSELVRRARAGGLDGIALCDHDSTAGWEEARAEGEQCGLEVIGGCEVSSRWRGMPVHMLAFFFDPLSAELVAELKRIREDRILRGEKMVAKLRELGVDVTLARVREIAQGESLGRPHIAQAMVEAGVIARVSDAFTREWIGTSGRAYVPKQVLSPQETLHLVAGAGGAAVIAHPVWIEQETHASQEIIEECAALGLAGLEIEHPDQDSAARRRFGRLADRLGLVRTAGSDYHGDDRGGMLGTFGVNEGTLAALRARGGKR